MIDIALARGVWRYDPHAQLGQTGGFGAVFRGQSPSGTPVAVKRLKISASEAAHRELRIASELLQTDLKNVLEVLDAGLDAASGRYFLVMPRADCSLQDVVDRTTHFPLPESWVIDVLHQIALGLLEVKSVIHRDLKPANILLHLSRWKIADFGIARFVEESTSLNTLRECLTPPYAAPEQWLLQKCTTATDLYALGCIAHAMLRGSPPFPGPTVEDFREQHLYRPAPDVVAGPNILRSLVLNLLAKAPKVRPSIDVVLATLSRLSSESIKLGSPGLRELAKVGTEIARVATEEEANKLAEAERERNRAQAGAEAREVLVRLVHALFDRIQEVLPLCSRRVNGSQEILDGANASLQFTIPYGRYATFLPRSGWDVLHSAHVELFQRTPSYRWSASLWFTDLARKQGYRWYEVSYFDRHLSQKRRGDPPFYLFPDDADEAAGPALGSYAIAFGPIPIDHEDAGAFMDRWAGLLAKAIQGQLRHPERLPLAQNEDTQP